MKSQVRSITGRDGTREYRYEALMFVCPGCAEDGGTGLHMLPISGDANGKDMWDFDGNLESPTVSPSILTGKGTDKVCHSFLRNGVFEFLGDCTHSLANQQVPIPDLPEWVTDEN